MKSLLNRHRSIDEIEQLRLRILRFSFFFFFTSLRFDFDLNLSSIVSSWSCVSLCSIQCDGGLKFIVKA